MRKLLPAITILILLSSCNGNDRKVKATPDEPGTVEQTISELKNKNFKVEEVGFISTFMGKEEPIEWTGSATDTSKRYLEYIETQKKISLKFITDTSLQIVDDQTNISALYELEKDTSAAVLLKIKYEDPEFSFPGATEPLMVTYTYKIRGIDDKTILLETPKSYNNRTVVYLMETSEK